MIEQVESMVAKDALPGSYWRCAPETRFAHQHAETLPEPPLRAVRSLG